MKHYIIFATATLIINTQHAYSMELIPAPTSCIEDKLVDKKILSLEDFKNRKFYLNEFKDLVQSPYQRKQLKITIKKTREIIKIKEKELDLKAMVSDIRRAKPTDMEAVEALTTYKLKLERLVKLLPKSLLAKAPYHETIALVTRRINLLEQIDIILNYDYNALTSDALEFITADIPDLLQKLNAPASERHKQLTAKFEQIKKLIEPEFNHESLVNRLLSIIKVSRNEVL